MQIGTIHPDAIEQPRVKQSQIISFFEQVYKPMHVTVATEPEKPLASKKGAVINITTPAGLLAEA